MRFPKIAVIAAAVLGSLALVAAPASAESSAEETLAAPDGNFYAYIGYGYVALCGAWGGNSSDWGRCKNNTASLFNNGLYGGADDVYVYWGTNQTGSRRGICRGAAIADLHEYNFELDGKPGQGQELITNIASHKWAAIAGCGA
ncbi:hypothetical protein [Amycolatopsis plumensis]|uniref:Peptidase inhibitor family I36 n=1 Tax=Amycolatopsis plumensis TaxID=236508 RepID=A0ABV5TZN8_9PSEU